MALGISGYAMCWDDGWWAYHLKYLNYLAGEEWSSFSGYSKVRVLRIVKGKSMLATFSAILKAAH